MGEFLDEYKRVALLPMALCGALMLNELALPEIPHPHPIEAMPLSPEDRFTIRPDGPCSITNPGNPGLPASVANACVAAYNDTKIALVNYDLSPDAANAYTEGVKSGLISITHGLLHPDIQVIPASDEAKQLIASTHTARDKYGLRCVNDQDPKNYVSMQANETMPQLDAFNFIVGVSSMSNCGHSMDGVNDDGRYIELFDSPSYGESQNSKDDAMIHELLHGVDLGHAGTIDCNIKGAGTLFNAPESPAVVDLGRCINNSSAYIEYGEYGEQMGTYTSDPVKAELNPIHANDLLWPLILAGTTDSKEHTLEPGKQQYFSLSDAVQGAFGTFKLNSPVTLYQGFNPPYNQSNPPHSHVFNELAITPSLYNRDDKGKITAPYVNGVQIYLVGDGNVTARVGDPNLGIAENPKAWSFKFGSKILNVTASKQGVEADLISK